LSLGVFDSATQLDGFDFSKLARQQPFNTTAPMRRIRIAGYI